MEAFYEDLLMHYNELLTYLESDRREVSKEMIQIIHDEIEDIMIELGRASQLQPNLFGGIGFEIEY